MGAFETSAIVEEQGRVLVAGVPFAPGTEVAITISPKEQTEDGGKPADEEALAVARDRMRHLFRTITGFRMSFRIPREELYERGRVR
jgi:hypothetical protein